jgi:hypothetical protein
MIQKAKNCVGRLADEAIARRGFWRSLPWTFLFFGVFYVAMYVVLLAVLGPLAYLAGGATGLLWYSVVMTVVLLPQWIGYAVYNAVRQMNLPTDWQDHG